MKKILILFSIIIFSNSCGLSEEEIIRQKKIDEESSLRSKIYNEYNLALNTLIKGYDLDEVYTNNKDKIPDTIKVDEIDPIGIYFSDIFPENKKFTNFVAVKSGDYGDEFSIKKAEVIFRKGLKKKYLLTSVNEYFELREYDFKNNYFILHPRYYTSLFRDIKKPKGIRYENAYLNEDYEHFTINYEMLEHKIKVPIDEAESFRKSFPFGDINYIVLFKIGKSQVIDDFKEECTKRLYNECIQTKRNRIKNKKIELIPERYIYYSKRLSNSPYIYANFKYKE